MIDIILGRRQISEYDDLVKAWQNEAGDTVRKEFMESMAAAKGVGDEETSMLKQEENELISSRRTRHADGQLHARVLGARDALVGAARRRTPTRCG